MIARYLYNIGGGWNAWPVENRATSADGVSGQHGRDLCRQEYGNGTGCGPTDLGGDGARRPKSDLGYFLYRSWGALR